MRGSSSTRLSLGNFQPNSPNRTSRVEVVDRTELRTRDWTHSGLSCIGTESVFINAAVSAGTTGGGYFPAPRLGGGSGVFLFGWWAQFFGLVCRGGGGGFGLRRCAVC